MVNPGRTGGRTHVAYRVEPIDLPPAGIGCNLQDRVAPAGPGRRPKYSVVRPPTVELEF